MKTAAIICEYNPFHNGHKYQIEQIRKQLSVDYVIALMSGNFVQRGEPAIMNKELRTRIALECGADLVLLLPVCVSTGSADVFAYGAVTILNHLNSVDYLVFGSECGNLELLKEAAAGLYENGTADSPKILELMKQGMTFAKARSVVFPEYDDLLSHSNNVLAIEYLQAMIATGSKISPYTILRTGSGYNESAIPQGNEFPSAKSIRQGILEIANTQPDAEICDEFLNYFSGYMPKAAIDLMAPLFNISYPVFYDNFSAELLYAILQNNANCSRFCDVSPALINRILNKLCEYTKISEFIDKVNSKDLTYARISRALLHILLNIEMSPMDIKTTVATMSHIRMMGFRKSSKELLTYISERSSICLVSKVVDVLENANSSSKMIFEEELLASSLYDYKVSALYGEPFVPEYSKPFIVV